MGPQMRVFVRQLSYSTAGLATANGLLLVAALVIGSAAGPEEFGQFSLIVAAAQLLVIPMLLGMDVATLRALARTAVPREQQQAVTAGLTVVAIAAGAVTLLGAALGAPLLALLLGVALSFRGFFDAVARGLGTFRAQALIRCLEALCMLGGVLFVIGGLKARAGENFAVLLLASSVATSGLYLAAGQKALLSARAWRSAVALELWRYVRFALLGSAGALLLVSADKLMIGRLLGEEQLGVYAAYHLLSVQLALQLSYIFVNAFFPAVAGEGSKGAVLKKLDRVMLVAAGPALLVAFSILFIGLHVLPNAYGFSWLLALGMSFSAVSFFLYQANRWGIASHRARGGGFCRLQNSIAGVGYLVGIYLFSPRLGLLAAPVAWLLIAAYLATMVRWWRRQFLRLPE
jgi:O-antigen/teichoic acid export membrane protein